MAKYKKMIRIRDRLLGKLKKKMINLSKTYTKSLEIEFQIPCEKVKPAIFTIIFIKIVIA